MGGLSESGLVENSMNIYGLVRFISWLWGGERRESHFRLPDRR